MKIKKVIQKVIVSDTAHRIWTVIGIVGALLGLYFLIAQTRSAAEQTCILSDQYRATYRPYLAIENIETQNENGSSLSILIDVKNYGQNPATVRERRQGQISDFLRD